MVCTYFLNPKLHAIFRASCDRRPDRQLTIIESSRPGKFRPYFSRNPVFSFSDVSTSRRDPTKGKGKIELKLEVRDEKTGGRNTI